jgi:hypothetical protein
MTVTVAPAASNRFLLEIEIDSSVWRGKLSMGILLPERDVGFFFCLGSRGGDAVLD